MSSLSALRRLPPVVFAFVLVGACFESEDDPVNPPPGTDLRDSGAPVRDAGSNEDPRSDGGDAGPPQDGDGGQGAPACSLPAKAGTTTESLVVDGETRTYMLVVPEGLTGQTRVPVILGFHGGTGTSEQASGYGLTGTEPALYVYPQANMHPTAGGVAWELEEVGGDDIPFVEALIPDLGKKHCIDTTRVFAAGQSNGAFFVNLLGCARPDLFRAIAPAAGGGPWTRCTKSTSAMVVHGTSDPTVSVTRGRESRDYWLKANGCSGASSTPVPPSPCVSYSGCAKPVLYCEHGGGHAWPSFAGAGIRRFFLSLDP